ncbi:MAG: serine hydrolase, partial [Flavobacteriaceae bacterium]
DGAIDFSIDKEINVASVTKFYTAIAVMQLLDANNLTIEDPIAPWLPASWETDNGVDGLSFKDLLKHESGLQSTNDNFDDTLGYEGLRNCINTGVVNSKSRNYLNVNFALFRVLIPSLWDASDDTNAINIELDGNTQFMYLLYMQENIFDRLQLPVVDCWPESPDLATLYYNVNDINNQTNGTYYNDWNNKSGGGGYFMSATEMAVVNAYFEHTEILVNASQRTIMKEHRLGMDLEDNAGREMHGNYYAKGGSIGNSSNIAISQGVLTQIAMFPINGIDCVVVMNCQGMTFPGNSNLRQLIYTAFNNAWE